MSETLITTTSVPTVGQARISSIAVTSTNTGLINTQNLVLMTDLGALGVGTLYEATIPQFASIDSLSVLDTPSTLVASYHFTNYLTFMVSLNGTVYKGFHNGVWETDYEMTEAEMEAVTELQWKDLASRIYQNTLVIKQKIINNHGTIVVTSDKVVNFAANQAPVINSSSLSPDTVNKDSSILTVNYEDQEGETVYYKLSVQKAGEGVFTAVEDWTSALILGTLTKNINYENLNTGLNVVKIELKDGRGATSNQTYNLTMTNTNPAFTYTNTTFNVTGTVTDADNDPIDIRVLINGVVKIDYTGFQASPRSFFFDWESSDLILDQLNTIRLEVKDSRGGTVSEEFQVLGRYRGLLFRDSIGDFYTTDAGVLLKLLDLGIIVAGQNTDPVQVVFVNSTGYAIENINIYTNQINLPENASLYMSFVNEPFVPETELTIVESLNDGETKNFYLALHTTPGRGKLNTEFEILATANATV